MTVLGKQFFQKQVCGNRSIGTLRPENPTSTTSISAAARAVCTGFRAQTLEIIPITVQEILDEEVTYKV
ncbi:MAG: hypothetical protein ACREJQ_03830 [bacterium]